MADAPWLRAADAAEAEIAALIHAAAFAGRERAWSAAEIAGLLSAPECFLLLAGAGAGPAPAAMLLGRAAAGEAELLSVGVDPAARRAGLGRLLVSEFERAAQARGAEAAFLEVAADNPGAIALYRALGWEAVGRRRAYVQRPDGTRVDAEVLRRTLA